MKIPTKKEIEALKPEIVPYGKRGRKSLKEKIKRLLGEGKSAKEISEILDKPINKIQRLRDKIVAEEL